MKENSYSSIKIQGKRKAYTDEERKNKYRFQERWQEKNGYRSKSYRLNEDTIKNLTQFSKENNVSQVSVLRNAYKRYIEHNSADFELNYETVVKNKRIDVKKDFKIKKDISDEIETTCKEHNYSYGYFVTTILDDYITNANIA